MNDRINLTSGLVKVVAMDAQEHGQEAAPVAAALPLSDTLANQVSNTVTKKTISLSYPFQYGSQWIEQIVVRLARYRDFLKVNELTGVNISKAGTDADYIKYIEVGVEVLSDLPAGALGSLYMADYTALAQAIGECLGGNLET